MAKKNKSNSSQPNAPDLQQILLDSPTNQQPPHNPYYPNLEADYNHQQYIPPPPYSDSTAPKRSPPYVNNNSLSMNNIPTTSGPMRSTISQQHVPTVIIQGHPSISRRDREIDRRNNNVRKFNNEMAAAAIIVILLSFLAHMLYSQRPCIDSFVVHKLNKDLPIHIEDVKQFQMYIAYASILVLGICILKCLTSRSDSHGCYVFTIVLVLFGLTLATGYLAYLAFYSPCTTDITQLAQSAVKSVFNTLIDTYPKAVAKEIGDANVFRWGQYDQLGIWIFVIDIFNFIIYFSGFISALSLC